LGGARALFVKEYGAEFGIAQNEGESTDKVFRRCVKAAQKKFGECFVAALAAGAAPTVPWSVATALWLAEGGGGRRVGALPDRQDRLLIEYMRYHRRQLRAEGMPPGKADQTTAEEYAPDRVEWALEQLRHPTPRKRKRKKSAGA
jgi:hypothetical protein